MCSGMKLSSQVVDSDNKNCLLTSDDTLTLTEHMLALDQYSMHLKKIQEIMNIATPSGHFLLLGDKNLTDLITSITNSDGTVRCNIICVGMVLLEINLNNLTIVKRCS